MTAQPLEPAVRTLIMAMLLGFASLAASPPVGQAKGLPLLAASGKHPAPPSPITLHIAAGYQNIYRDTAWTPVRITLHNASSAGVSGTVLVPQSNLAPTLGGSQTFHGLYQQPVVLPPDATKQVTLYVPGSGVQSEIQASFQQGTKILASATAFPAGVDSSTLLIGVMAAHPADEAWVLQASQAETTTHVLRLSQTTLDPVPQVLATFDLIVLTDVDTSQIDQAQLVALHQYVDRGGTLLLVGGPAWQQTLRPLPATLLPGRLAGTRVLPDLHALLPLASLGRPTGPQGAAVSLLSHPSGTVLASQAGVPLVVRQAMGNGAVEYLAFDPSQNPVQAWNGAPRLLGRLLAGMVPLAITRTWSPGGFRLRFGRIFSQLAITDELSNVPAATVPLLALIAVLTLLYLFLLGPANFLVLRRMQRQYLAWVTIPALAVSYVGATAGVTAHLKNSSVLINSVGMVRLDGAGPSHPATYYLGLVAPLSGNYHLNFNTPALTAPIPPLNRPTGFFWRGTAPAVNTSLGMKLEEGSRTQMTFLAMKQWSTRDVLLNTTASFPGTVSSNLTVNARGDIVGSIHNGTNLDLLDPIIVAGQDYTHIPDIRAGATVQSRVRPHVDLFTPDQPSVWTHLYGAGGTGDDFGGFGGCCDQQFSPPVETNLGDRVRNAVSLLTQAETLQPLGEVALLGWSERPLDGLTVDGSIPQQRVLTLVAVPLVVHFPASGSFRLRQGTVGARLVDILPKAPQATCCSFFSRDTRQITVGTGGSLTFEFDLPNSGRVRFRRLDLMAGTGADGTQQGSVFNWQTRRWFHVDLSGASVTLPKPSQFVGPGGQVLLRLEATANSGDVTVDDPYLDLQISGSGAAAR